MREKMQMNILVITDKPFPYGSAYSSRVRHFVLAFLEMGAKITVLSANLDVDESERLGLQNVEYISMNYLQNRITQLGIGVAKRYGDYVKKLMKEQEFDAVFVNSITYALPRICKISHENKIPVYVEKCEWYDESSFIFGKFNPYYREYIKEIDSVKPDGYITISPLFDDYYKKKGFQSICIPTIVDTGNIAYSEHEMSSKVRIVFSGSLGNGKELIKPIAESIKRLGDKARLFSFIFYGPTEEQIRNNILDDGLFKEVKENMTICGQIPQARVYGKLREADFSIFLRENRRSSNAGFPTKLAESMAVGTPVITNTTGSIEKYLTTEKNGFLLQTATADELTDVFYAILKLENAKYRKMRFESRKVAEENFDYRKYIEDLSSLFLGRK